MKLVAVPGSFLFMNPESVLTARLGFTASILNSKVR